MYSVHRTILKVVGKHYFSVTLAELSHLWEAISLYPEGRISRADENLYFPAVAFPLCEASPLWDIWPSSRALRTPLSQTHQGHLTSLGGQELTFLPTTVFLMLCPQHLAVYTDIRNLFSPGSLPDSSACLNGDSQGSPQIPSALSRSHHPCPPLIHMPQTLSPVAENTSLFKENKMAS